MIHAFVIFQVPISHFADHCHRRLERAQATGAKRGVRKPTMDEIEQAKVSLEASKFIYTQSMVWWALGKHTEKGVHLSLVCLRNSKSDGQDHQQLAAGRGGCGFDRVTLDWLHPVKWPPV